MLDATETKTGLDAIQVAALRKGDTVCFFHRHVPDTTGETSYICATKKHEANPIDPFGPRETSIIIPVEWRLRDYTRGEKIPYDSADWKGFSWIGSARYHEEWVTIASLLRVGDKLTLLWQRGGFTTEAQANATPHFYGDSLSLLVERGERQLQFHIETSVSEDNTARMIRRY
jgi:hypothetical protein